MSPRSRPPANPSLVYLPDGPEVPPQHVLPDVMHPTKRGNKQSSRTRKDPVLSALTSGEEAAIELAAFVEVKNTLQRSGKGIPIASEDFERLKTGGMLNDSLLDSFFVLLQMRNQKDVPRFPPPVNIGDEDVMEIVRPRALFFNTYFYTLLRGQGTLDYDRVRTWLSRSGEKLQELDAIFIPINTGYRHWVLVVLNLREQSVLFYDPMKGSGDPYIRQCCSWLKREYDESGIPAPSDPQQWPSVGATQLPMQNDSTSCGLYIAFVAEAMERGRVPEFCHTDVSILRKRCILYFLNGEM